MKIYHNLEKLSESQKSNLKIAQMLLDTFESIKKYPMDKTSLNFDGEKFSTEITGSLGKFLVEDIHLALGENVTKHISFIEKAIQKEFKDYDGSTKSAQRKENLKLNVNLISEYYSIYPMYTENTDFKVFSDILKRSIHKGLLES